VCVFFFVCLFGFVCVCVCVCVSVCVRVRVPYGQSDTCAIWYGQSDFPYGSRRGVPHETPKRKVWYHQCFVPQSVMAYKWEECMREWLSQSTKQGLGFLTTDLPSVQTRSAAVCVLYVRSIQRTDPNLHRREESNELLTGWFTLVQH